MAENGLVSKLRKVALVGALSVLSLIEYIPAKAQINANAASLSQTVALADCLDEPKYVCVDYNATLTDVDSATRIINKIKNSGVKQLISNKTITVPPNPYHEVLSMNKGRYEFKLKSPDATTSKVNANVPNYAPTANFSSLETRIEKDASETYNLCGPIFDRNSEDNPVPIVKAKPLTGNITTTLSGCNLTVNATGEPGPYQVNVNFGVKKPRRPLPSAILAGEIIATVPPSVFQTVSLVRDVDIDYKATLTNVPSATRTITHNGNSFGSPTTITTSPYTEMFDDMRKGNYSFRLEASGATPDIVSIGVPNYLPKADFGSLDTNFNDNEDSSKTFNLESLLSDRNPEDRPVPLISATTLSGDVSTSISGSNLTITATGEPGPYQVEVNFGSDSGGLASEIIQGDVFDLVHLIGQLQDARTNTLELKTSESGIIHVYNAADNTFLKEYLTDPQGNFDFKLDQPGISEIFLQARIVAEIPIGINDGFVRTIKLPGRDTKDILVRVYPYNEVLSAAEINRANFRKHLEEINPLLLKSKVESIEIIDVDPLGRGSFTPEFMELIKNKILDPNDIGCYVDPVERGGIPLNVQIDNPDSIKHYHIEGNEIIPDKGWGIFVRDTTIQGANARTFNEYMFRIATRPETEAVAAHEFGHAFIAPHNHALTLFAGTQTIMRADAAGRSTPGPGDCEAAKIIYEATYELQGEEGIRIEPYDNILGLDFCIRGVEFCPKKK
ncbi:MAG TPA: hypothetical protein VJ142_02270 [Candidatus Nanoarchaeia archaeon]|nr:hypothetical protein [Candidatus Nanoarchaeia archaeon]